LAILTPLYRLGRMGAYLLAGAYAVFWVWSSPRMLLIGQACVISVSIVSVFLFAERRQPGSPGWLDAERARTAGIEE
jgi:uncharacterized membrane protein